MTDKQKILAEIERMQSRLDLDTPFGIGAHTNLGVLKDFINSLHEEPVSEEIKMDIKDEATKEVKGILRGELLRLLKEQKEKFAAKSTERCAGSIDCINSILSSLQFVKIEKWPVSEDLEEAAKRYSDNEDPICTCEECLLKSFKEGAKWQKEKDQSTIELAEDHAMLAGMNKMEEQMMAKAIDAQCFGFQGAALFSFRLPADNYLVGSKVKVIVIKEK